MLCDISTIIRKYTTKPGLARGGLFALTFALFSCAAAPPPLPTLRSTFPADTATEVLLNTTLSATFDMAMAPLNSSMFVLTRGTTSIAGTVSMSADRTTAVFTPTDDLAGDTEFTATIFAGAKSAAGGILAADHTWQFTTGTTIGTSAQPPTLVSTYPAAAASDVALNSKLLAVFDMPMKPSTLTSDTFTLTQGATAVTGAVSLSSDGTTATFAPASALHTNSAFTATITRGAQSAAGAAFSADSHWTFMTGVTTDTTAPAVSATDPANGAEAVATNTTITATFNKPMDPLTITKTSFSLSNGTTAIAGSVTYGPGAIATFTATTALPINALLTATLGAGIKDLQGNALAGAFAWSFTTGAVAGKGPARVVLGTAGNFVILAKTGISTVPTSAITGDIAVSPAAQSYLTGFALIADHTNIFATSTQLVGTSKAYAANNANPTPQNLTTAVGDMQTAYTDAAGRSKPDFLELGSGNIGGKTLVPGLYKWTSDVTIPSDVTIAGGANDVWIFQTSGNVTMSAAMHVILAGALAKNIFWQVAGETTIGANANFSGIMLCKTGVTIETNATFSGRILAQTAVALQKATVTQPAP